MSCRTYDLFSWLLLLLGWLLFFAKSQFIIFSRDFFLARLHQREDICAECIYERLVMYTIFFSNNLCNAAALLSVGRRVCCKFSSFSSLLLLHHSALHIIYNDFWDVFLFFLSFLLLSCSFLLQHYIVVFSTIFFTSLLVASFFASTSTDNFFDLGNIDDCERVELLCVHIKFSFRISLLWPVTLMVSGLSTRSVVHSAAAAAAALLVVILLRLTVLYVVQFMTVYA